MHMQSENTTIAIQLGCQLEQVHVYFPSSRVPHVASRTGDGTTCMELGGRYTCVLAGHAGKWFTVS